MIAHVIAAFIGIWLMVAPAVLGYGDPAQTNDRIIGPVVATFAIVAWWEATRNVRWANIPLGGWMVLAPLILGYGATAPIVNSIAAGLLIVALSFVRGEVKKPYGGGWRSLFRDNPPHERAMK